MSRAELPKLSEMNSRLARNNQRVAKYFDALPERIEALVEASSREDFGEVRRLAEFLARSSKAYDLPHMHSPAQALCDEINQPTDATVIRRGVERLIGAYRRMRTKA